MTKLLEQIKATKKSFLVIGDVMIDEYYYGDTFRISPEAPVPVFKYDKNRLILGGASNVAANLADLNQQVSLLTVIGKDSGGENFLKLAKENSIDTSLVVIDDKRKTTIKTRLLAHNNQQLIRIDKEEVSEFENEIYISLINKLKLYINKFDIIIVSDYLKGLLSEKFLQEIISISKENNIKVLVDPKDKKLNKYKNAFLIKPNKKELHDLTGLNFTNSEELLNVMEQLMKDTSCENCLVTKGSEGMTFKSKDGTKIDIPSLNRDVYDVTGAGDTVMAFLALGFAHQFDVKETLNLANIAAGIKVGKVGTSTVKVDEIENYYNKKLLKNSNIFNYNDLDNLLKTINGKKVVFTNGCFDILHLGHLRYLNEARELGDVLVVGLNSDSSIKRIKGEQRPINNEESRAEMLSALKFVDYVVIFNQDTPIELIEKIKPNVLVKGSDYKLEDVIGKNVLDSYGGEVKLIQFVEGNSTTRIIEKIKAMK